MFKSLEAVSWYLHFYDKPMMLVKDARVLEGITAQVGGVVPALQQEYDEIMQELEKENAEVAEIEASDQDYLNELKASIAEQK